MSQDGNIYALHITSFSSSRNRGRVSAATNRDMQRMVADGQFRQDLYYRLSAFPIRIPSLRERKDDIVALTENFLYSLPEGERHIPLSSDVIEKLLSYDYLGSERELRNIIERATILACDDILRPDHIVLEESSVLSENGVVGEKAQTKDQLVQRRGRLTDKAVLDAPHHTHGHRSRAAQLLGVSDRTLYRHIQRMRGG